MATTEYFRVREAFVTAAPKGGGQKRRFNAGDLIPAGDPVVKRCGNLLEPVGSFVERTGTPPTRPHRQAQPPRSGKK